MSKTGPNMVKTGADCVGMGNEHTTRECDEMGTVFEGSRIIRQLLQEALNNSASVRARLRDQEGVEGGKPEKQGPESLEDILTDCNYLARCLVNVSQELSGIIGE